jgi:hypothetical protein
MPEGKVAYTLSSISRAVAAKRPPESEAFIGKHQEAPIITAPDDFLIDAVIDAAFGSPREVNFSLPPLPKHRAHTWKQRDVTRGLRACQAAGVAVRVEILPDGKLVLIPIASTPDTDNTDDILARLA